MPSYHGLQGSFFCRTESGRRWESKVKRPFCCYLVAQLCPTLCDPMDCSTPGFPILHHLPDFAQTHVHWVNDSIPPSHPLSPPFPPALSLSQHQGLFHWVGSFHQVTWVMELQLQHQSFQWIFRVDFLSDWLVWSPCCPRDSQESSPAPQFESINSSVLERPIQSEFCWWGRIWKC